MDNDILNKRNWRTGYFIRSGKTAHWPERQIELTNETENRTVFANFTEEDKGRSRKRICTCENKEDAAFIVTACNEYDSLNNENRILKETLNVLIESFPEVREVIKQATIIAESIKK